VNTDATKQDDKPKGANMFGARCVIASRILAVDHPDGGGVRMPAELWDRLTGPFYLEDRP
jgi:hypothetical protein